MADKTITMYSPSGKSIDIEARKEAYDSAVKNGWSKDKPSPKGTGADAPYAPGKPGNKKEDEEHFTKPGFAAGFGAGINPFHSAPENMPNPGTMGAVGNAAADSFNMREIVNRAQTGDVKGAVGQGLGTAAGTFGPMAVKAAGKAIKGSAFAARALKEVPLLAKAADKGTKLAKSIKVTPEIARFASRYTMPLFNAIDTKFEAVHQLLEKAVGFPVSRTATQLINRMAAKAEIPSISKLANELKGRTALGYREGESLRRMLGDMIAHGEAEHWEPQVRKLAAELESEIQNLAKANGVGDLRKEFQSLYHDTMQLAKAVASTAKTKAGVLRPAVSAGMGMVGHNAGAIADIGAQMGKEVQLKISPVVRVQAEKLAKRLGVDIAELESHATKAEKAGGAMQNAGRVAQAAPAVRAGMSVATQKPQEQPQQ